MLRTAQLSEGLVDAFVGVATPMLIPPDDITGTGSSLMPYPTP